MITSLDDDLWVVHHPNRFLGMEFGVRMTIIRLASGGIMLHSPVPISDSLAAEIDQLGMVRYLIAPNLFHHLFVADAVARWPDAVLYAPAGLDEKRPDLTIHRILGSDPLPDGIDGCTLAGMKPLSETVLFHAPSATLICCDLLLNITQPRGLWAKLYLTLNGINGRPGVSKVLAKSAFKDTRALRGSIDEILEWPFERLIVSHGDVLETDAAPILRESFQWMN